MSPRSPHARTGRSGSATARSWTTASRRPPAAMIETTGRPGGPGGQQAALRADHPRPDHRRRVRDCARRRRHRLLGCCAVADRRPGQQRAAREHTADARGVARLSTERAHANGRRRAALQTLHGTRCGQRITGRQRQRRHAHLRRHDPFPLDVRGHHTRATGRPATTGSPLAAGSAPARSAATPGCSSSDRRWSASSSPARAQSVPTSR